MYVFEGSVLAKKGFSSIPATAPTGVGIVNTNGIEFPVTQVASSNINTLDDYEEGSWNPVDSSGAGIALDAEACRWTKVGRIVHLQIGNITYAANASVLQVIIGGLPFVPQSTSSWSSGSMCAFNNAVAFGAGLMCQAGVASLYGYKTNASALTNIEMSARTIYGYSMTYVTNT